MKNIEKFKEEVDKLHSLMNADEQGCGCWWGILDRRMRNLSMMYFGNIPTPIAFPDKGKKDES